MKTKYRNVAFLAELLINILVFSISCAVLAGLFVKAWQISRDTSAESRAGVEVQALVATVKARGTGELEHALPQADGTVLCHYDKDWQPLAPPYEDRNAIAYTIALRVEAEDTGAGTLTHIAATAAQGESAAGRPELFQLETATYTPAGGAE